MAKHTNQITRVAWFVVLGIALQGPALAQEPTDGSRLIIRASVGVTSATEMSGATLCLAQGDEQDVADYFIANGMEYQVLLFAKPAEAISAYAAGRGCDALVVAAADADATRSGLADANEHIILPETLGSE